MRVAAVIPAFDEAPTVGDVVRGAGLAGLEPIVVDDGSSDETGAIARAAGAAVRRHERNRGKGTALATGFRAALDAGCDAAIVIDADGQHDTRLAPRFLEVASRAGADLVVGTRMRGRRGMPLVRWATNAMMSNLLSMISGVRLTDTQCGMKLISRRLLEGLFGGGGAVSREGREGVSSSRARASGADAAAERFDIESEIILRAAASGFRIREAPISTIYIPGRRSRIRPLPDTIRFLWLVARHALVPDAGRCGSGRPVG